MKYGWSLDALRWKSLETAAQYCEWSRVYLERDYASQVPTDCGVYLICACPTRIPVEGRIMEYLYNAVYAGQASNLRKRFRQHVRGYGNVRDAIPIFRRLDFWYSQIRDDDIDNLEQCLIDALGPSANVKNVRARIGNPLPAGRATGV